jgi:death-on-curing protein
MPRLRREPTWLSAEVVRAIHDDLLLQHGGMPGVRDAGVLESALGRPRFRWAYGEASDLLDCAAAYGFGIAKNHPFNDGNKRTAFQAMYTFLAINGIELTAPEVETVTTMLGVADGRIGEATLGKWLRANGVAPRARRPAKAKAAPRAKAGARAKHR